jgi:hypothetical protein
MKDCTGTGMDGVMIEEGTDQKPFGLRWVRMNIAVWSG